jgi:hypothetical protein
MKHWLSNFWDWYSEEVIAVSIIVSIALSMFLGLGFLEANKLKYNCDLNKRPSFYTALMINDKQYAYDPKGFCDKLKEKMGQE